VGNTELTHSSRSIFPVGNDVVYYKQITQIIRITSARNIGFTLIMVQSAFSYYAGTRGDQMCSFNSHIQIQLKTHLFGIY